MKVRWTPEAENDRFTIYDYIAVENPLAAARMDDLFAEAVAKLADFPLLGFQGQISGTRELIPHENYRLVYQINDDTVWILSLLHTARLWPPLLH